MKRLLFLIFLLTQLSIAYAQSAFVVRDIEFEGLQRIAPATVENYLPIKRGQTLQPAKTAAILQALYHTGFFDHITLSREGNTLIIHVVERPTIGQLKITGNSVIPTDKLTSVMKTLDVAEGRVYNPAILEKIKQSLLNQYYQLGRYNARVNIQALPMPRNRVMVKIDISEGLIAKIRRITIIGNRVFSEKTLVSQLEARSTGWFTWFTQTDRYSEERLEASIEKLRAFYLDHGYLRFEVKSSQAQVSPDRKSVYITIVIAEGEPYTIASYSLEGNLILPREELMRRMCLKPGEIFSRQKIMDSEKAIGSFYGENGYLFSSINLRPQVNDSTRQVVLVFEVKPGKRAYVRQVTFSDNMRTNDVVLRREIQQMEGAPASTAKLEESKHRLVLLPYIKDVDMAVKPVPDFDDQVDVDYKVKEETGSAQASFKVGYSQVYKTVIGLGLNQKNFFGTGNALGINLSRSSFEQFYSIDYSDPYYTSYGVSRTFNFSVSRVNPGAAKNVVNTYTTNEYNLGVLYGIPVGLEPNVYSRILAGVNFQSTTVNLTTRNPIGISNQVLTFIKRHGRRFTELDFKLGYSRDSRDRAIFPTCGNVQSFTIDSYAPMNGRSLSFYILNYRGTWYRPITGPFIFTARADLAYGNGFHGYNDYPFFRNFYAGGIDSVRGYLGYTLGPKDSLDKAYGGNMLADGSIGLIFPNFISDNLRTSWFIDGGNVYLSNNNRNYGGQSTNSGPIRFSTGIEADWMTPIAPIRFSIGIPLNKRHGDESDIPQFALSANF